MSGEKNGTEAMDVEPKPKPSSNTVDENSEGSYKYMCSVHSYHENTCMHVYSIVIVEDEKRKTGTPQMNSTNMYIDAYRIGLES